MKMYAMKMECSTDFNTNILKQCLVSTGGGGGGVMFHRKKIEIEKKNFV